MTITYTGNLKLALPTTGTEAGTWGDVVNQQITTLLDQSVSGTVSLTSMTNADYTLTNGNGSSPNEARYMALSVPSTLTLTAARNIIVPSTSKAYIIRNLTTGGFAVTLKTSAGTGISVPNGKTMILYCDGTNVIDGTDYFTSIATGNLSYTGTLTGGTGIVNIGSGQVYKDASGNVGIGTSSPGAKLDVRGNATFTGNATARQTADFTNTGGQLYVGTESSAGGAVFTGSSAYAGILGTNTNTVVQLATNSVVRATLDTSGNLGLGVTPSAWSGPGNFDLLEGAGISFGASGGVIASNGYYNLGWKYKGTGYAVKYDQQQALGYHAWYTAPSGTAGNAITFTQAMTLDASGNLGIGTSSPGYKLDVAITGSGFPGRFATNSGTAANDAGVLFQTIPSATASLRTAAIYLDANGANASGGDYLYIAMTGSLDAEITNQAAGPILFKTTGTERMRIDASGNLGLGVTPSAWGASIRSIDIGFGTALTNANSTTDSYLSSNAYYTTQWLYKNTAAASFYRQASGAHQWHTAPSGTAGAAITFTQAMTLDASGNLLVGQTSLAAGERIGVTGSVANYLARWSNSNATPSGHSIYYSGATPNNAASQFLYCWDATALRFEARSNGGLANFSANNVNLSDVRTKKDIQDAPSYLDRICAIPVRTFLYKDQTDSLLNLGVIAQEVEAQCPELVDVSGFGETPEDGVPLKAVYQTDLQYALMKCIQEQQALITSLTARIAALEAK